MRIVNEFAPGAIPGGATIDISRAPAHEPAKPRRFSLVHRAKALARLLMRRRAALAIARLEELDVATRRDLGLGERGASTMDVAARVAAARYDTELNYLLSASSRFAVRNVDAGL